MNGFLGLIPVKIALAVVGITDATSILSDSTNSGGFNPLSIIQYGVLGVVLLAVFLGYLWPKPAVERLIEDKDRSQGNEQKMMETYSKDILPALTASNEVLKVVIESQKTQNELTIKTQVIMEEVTSALDWFENHEEGGRPPRRRRA